METGSDDGDHSEDIVQSHQSRDPVIELVDQSGHQFCAKECEGLDLARHHCVVEVGGAAAARSIKLGIESQ